MNIYDGRREACVGKRLEVACSGARGRARGRRSAVSDGKGRAVVARPGRG